MKKTIPFLLLLILFAIATWFFFAKEPEQVHELQLPQLPASEPAEVRPSQPQVDESVAIEEPEIIPEPLPQLNESDPEISRALSEVTGTDELDEYLVQGEVISRVVATIDSLTSRQVPAQINPVKPAHGKFVAQGEGENITLSAANFARYDGYVALLQMTSPDALAALYKRYYPLFQQAWEENGGEGSFNDRLLVVIDHLSKTPDIPGPVHLYKPEAVYLFEDPALEAMSAGQKVLVRMGSANASVVKEKLLELSTKLNKDL